MKYYFVSDLHGEHPLILETTLWANGFNKETDTLVVLGDVVDRGNFSIPLLKYLNSLPHMIAIRGNHDMRDWELILKIDTFNKYDRHNGVEATLRSIMDSKDAVLNGWAMLQTLTSTEIGKANTDLFLDYISKAYWAIEFTDLIATHGWLPFKDAYIDDKLHRQPIRLISNWREIHWRNWYNATWANSASCFRDCAYPNKRLVVGHWFAAEMRARYDAHEMFADYIKKNPNYGVWERNDVVFIDPCIGLSNQINVYIYETDEIPFVYAADSDSIVRPHKYEGE